MNGVSRPWRAGFIGGSGCSVGAGDHPKMQENVRKAVKNIRVISRKEMTRIILHTSCRGAMSGNVTNLRICKGVV